MKTHTWGAAVLAALLGLAGLAMLGSYRAGAFPAAGQAADKQPPAAGKEQPARRMTPAMRREEEQAIRKAVKAYSDTFNKADLDALTAFWTEDAEYVSDTGKTVRGRDAVRTLLKKSLESFKGSKQSIQVRGLRFIKPDVVSEDGAVFMTSPEGAVEPGRYTALWVKHVGKWLISSVRDLPGADVAERSGAYTKLKPLAWMVGEWEEKAGGHNVRMSCKWSPNQTFLVQEFTFERAGKVMSATQRIGWDAHNERLRSWVFDSAGGFGEGFWTRQGNTWEIQAEGIFPDGRVASSVNRWKFIDENTAEWSSKDRQADETPLPDLQTSFVRSTSKPVSAPVRSKP